MPDVLSAPWVVAVCNLLVGRNYAIVRCSGPSGQPGPRHGRPSTGHRGAAREPPGGPLRVAAAGVGVAHPRRAERRDVVAARPPGDRRGERPLALSGKITPETEWKGQMQ